MLASRRLLFQSAGMRMMLELRDKLSAPVGETAAPAPSLSEIERRDVRAPVQSRSTA